MAEAATALSPDNPFASLIPQAAPVDQTSSISPDNPFASLIPQAQPRQPSRGFIGEVTNSFLSTLIRENPKLAGNALEGFAELMETTPAEKAGALVGGMVPRGKGAPPPAIQQPNLRDVAAAIQEYGKKGEEERRPAVPSLFDIRTDKGLGTLAEDAGAYLGQAIGQGAGSSAPSIVIGLGAAAVTENPIAGFLAGAAGPSYIQNFGDTYGAMRDDKDIQAAVKAGKLTQKNVAEIAAAFSIPMAALDTLQAERIFGAAAKQLKGNIVKRMMKRAVMGAATEAPTEAAQQVMQEAALEVGGGQKSFADQAKAVTDAFVAGGLGAGPISALRPGPRAPDEVTPPPGTQPPPPGGGAVPPGAMPAEDIIPGVEIVPESEAPPAPVLQPTPGRQMVVNDPEITLANGEVLPAGAMNGQIVTVATSDENMSFVLDAEGKRHLIGNKLLAPLPPAGAPPAAPTLDEAMQQGVADEVAKRAAVPDSPRLTPSDRASPIPNDLIDEGKAATEAATGTPSTYTTTTEINGRREVVTGRVADLVAQLRANTEALAEQITAGVSVPQISPEAAQGAPPARTTEVPAISLPSQAAAAPEPSIATPAGVAPEVLPEPRFAARAPEETAALERRFGPVGTQARTLEEARMAKRDQPIVTKTEEGDTIEVSHPYYETFEARINGQKVGELNVSPQGPHASSVTVQPAAQRKGVATALYNAAEAALGRPMTPSPMGMSGDAIAFWKQRMSGMEPEQKQAILQEALDKGIEQKIGKSARARVDALGYVESAAAPQGAPAARFAVTPGAVTPTAAAPALAPSAAAASVNVRNEDGTVEVVRVPDEIVEQARQLKEAPEKYFETETEGTQLIPVANLVQQRARPKGIANAVGFMAEAYRGEKGRRGPIHVKDLGNGNYLVLDGNSTTTIAAAAGWKNLPAIVMTDEQFAEVERAKAEKKAAKKAAAEAEAAAASHTTSFMGEDATDEQKALFYRHPYKTVDEIYEDAQARQDELAAVGKEIASKLGIRFKNPGLKIKEESVLKIDRKEYEDAGRLSDCIRAGFDVSEPGQANAIVRALARHFEVLDEFWAFTPAGYFDRKVLVRFDDGRIGEIQIWEPNVLRAKEQGIAPFADGEKGKVLYNTERKIKDKHSPKAIKLNRQMRELYSHALSLATPVWSVFSSKVGSASKPAPKFLNLKRQSASVITRQELKTSETSTLTQSAPGLSSALASKSEKTTGRSSQLQNLTELPSFPDETVPQNLPEAKLQARTLREGTETPESMGLPQTEQKGKKLKRIRYTTRQIAAALEARQRARYGTIARDDRSPEARDRISDWIVDEVEFEQQPGREQQSGVGWYSSKFQRALNIFGSTFPELLRFRRQPNLPGVQRLQNRKNARDFMTAIIAVTSDGQLAAQNFENAARLYGEFRQTGTIDIDRVTFGGDRNASIKTNLANILHLLEQHGPAEMHRVLMQEETVTDLKQLANNSDISFTTKFQAHVRMPLASLVFGPKLGAFYANLMGAHGYLTMDRWWSRTFNRYRGQILKRVSGLAERPTDRQGNRIGLARFKEMIGQPNLSDEEAMVEAFNHAQRYQEKKFKNGTDIEKAANTIRKDALGTEDTPFGSVDRTFMIETTELARQKLASRGIDISIADIQAILWYFEKRLYSELGARATADISYEEVANRVTQRAVEGDRSRRPDISDVIEGPDGVSFSISEEARLQRAEGRGREDRGEADARAARTLQQEVAPLKNLYELYPSSVGPNADVVAAKRAYMESIGLPYRRQAEYVEADPKRGKRIADAFEAMAHNPSDPQVAAAYRALIDETIAQYHALQKALKLKIEFIKKGQENPYNFSPRQALQDVLENGHLWVYPTESGFGTTDLDVSNNPLLEQTDIVVDGHKLLANDVFRIVHDIFGHGPEGAGFGPTGEENAWQSHVRMYSPLAARAMTTETRGQNSWVNFGPHGEANRSNQQATVYADQKVGLLPEWAMTEGMAADEAARLKIGTDEADAARRAFKERVARNAEMAREILPGQRQAEATVVQGGVIHFALSPQFADKAAAVFKDLRKILDSYGLNNVDLKVWQQMFADLQRGAFGIDGMYLQNTIHYALNAATDAATTMHHEVVHGLWSLFTDTERAILSRKSNKEWITDEIRQNYPENQWTEEGVARAHAEWRKGMKVDGVIAKIFRKIDLLLKAIAKAFTGQDFRTAEDIFRQMATGEVGRRGEIGLEVPTPQSDGLFQIAWHGSASKFIQFSKDFIGTGSGYSLYGTGLYFAGRGDKEFVSHFGDHIYEADIPNDSELLNWDERLSEMSKSVQAKVEKLFAQYGSPPKVETERIGAGYTPKDWKRIRAASARGGTEEQMEMMDAIDAEKVGKGHMASGPTGAEIYSWLGNKLAPDGDRIAQSRLASERLAKAGIPGHQFFNDHYDGYVIYDADRIKVLSVNGEKVTGTERKQALEEKTAADTMAAEAPMFHLQAPPHNQQQAQAVTQGFIARGQPVDRAIRVAYNLLGGLDNQNRWSWGKRLSEKLRLSTLQEREAAGIGGLIGSGIGTIVGGPGLGTAAGALAGGTVGRYVLGGPAWTTNGAFGWFGSFAENAKRGLISDYGLDPEYVEAYRQSDLGKADIERQAAGILQVLSNAGVNSNEAKVLQQILTGQPVNDAAMIRLAQPIRQAIDDLGAEAVSLGLISAESFERNRGAYLHRVYAKNEIDQGTMAGWVSAKMATRRKRIIGDTMKGRGMFWDMPLTRLMQDAGIHPAPNKGDKWVVLDRKSATGDKVTKRVFFPAGKPIPMEFQGTNWESRGEWEVRQTGKGEVTLWRDYTPEERTKMGELVDARYTIAKTFMLMANDLSTGRFYRDVAAKQEWTRADKPPDGTWKEGGEYNAKHGRYWENPEIRWVKVPDTTISDTGGKKRWGALSGKWVRAEIWRDLNEINIASNPGVWRKLYTQWKRNKTSRNPVVHMNNIVSNLLFMDLADVRMQDLLGGLKAYYKETSDYIEARDNGAFGSDIVSQELRENVLKPILDEIAKQQSGGQMFASPFMQRAKVLGIVADKLWTWAKFADDRMLRAYQMEDEVFRMAAYMRRRSQGESPAVAARNARDQFLNYDIRAPWVVLMRNSLFPFISYTYRAVPKLMENIMHRPLKIAKYAAIAYAVNALAYMLDDDDDEEKERAALRDQEQGRTWLGTPRMLRMPWRDDNGLPVFFDVRRWIPAGDIFDSAQGTSAVPIPAPLHFGGPLTLAFELAFNRSAFTGEDITNKLTDTNMEKAEKVADYAWKAWMPAAFWMPNSWYWNKISDAVHGGTDTAGHPYSVPQALLSSFGIKVKPLDVDDGVKWHFLDFKKVEMSLRHDMHSLASRLERGLISQEAFDKGAATIMRKFENLGVRAEELARTQRAK